MRTDKMSLGGFLYETGHHVAGWRHPSSNPMGGHDIAVSIECAKALEDAKFDLLFFQDDSAIREWGSPEAPLTARGSHFEEVTHAAALSALTSRIGIVATASTSFHAPFSIARQFASLDQLSKGRAGWNLVTSTGDNEARNFGTDKMALHGDRYERAEEFVDVVLGLWNTWQDGALLADPASGVFFDETRVRALDHKGKHFSVRGPLNMARSPQGHPVVVQAGASDDGRKLGARTAEIIFIASQTLKEAQEFYGDVKDRMQSFGRSPQDLRIMPGLSPVVGRSEADARARMQELQDLIDPVVGVGFASRLASFDLSGYDIDGPIPDIPVTNAFRSRQQLIVDLARREGLTIRQLYLRVAGARGHAQIVGTPAQIADEMEARFMANGADGFNIMPPTLPGGLHDFIELVMPELRRRGLVRTEYEAATLRGNLGTRPGMLKTVPRA